MKNLWKKHKAKIIYALIIALIVSTQFQPTKALYKALFTAPELIQDSPVKPLKYLTRKPIVKEIVIENSGRKIYADLYIPNDRKKHAAAVLDLGLDIDRKDPRVTTLAETFARNGYVILTPNIPYLATRRLTLTAVDDFIASYNYLTDLPNVKKNKVGFIGFCTSGGLTLIAAENDKIKDRVNFTFVVNPYFDLASLYKSLTTREVNGQTWLPHAKSVEVYNRETIALIGNPQDEIILFNNLVNIGEENLTNGNFPKLTEEDEQKLSKQGKFVYDGLTNKEPNMSSYYLENVNDAQRKFKLEMSPATNIDNLNAKTYIFVDKTFNYIPYSEGEILAETLKEKGKNFTFKETSFLPTSQLIQGLTWKNYLTEGTKLMKFISVFFREVN